MDKNLILSKFNKELPNVKILTHSFGRTRSLVIEVKIEGLVQSAEFLRSSPGFLFDRVENLNISQVDQSFIFTYFLTSSSLSRPDSQESEFILRVRTPISHDKERVVVPTLSQIWPSVRVFEDEATELFGFFFGSGGIKKIKNLLPEGLKEFPLRKSYSLPQASKTHLIQKSDPGENT